MLTTHHSRCGGQSARLVASLRFLALVAVASLVLAAQPARADIATYVVFDASSGTVIDQKDPTRPWHPASITKLMTAYVTFKALKSGRLKLTSPVYYSANARKEPPSKMGFPVGTILTVDNALKIVMVKSANDVAMALGESVAGSEAAFVKRMNTEARRLGMRDTRFTNPNGLPDKRQVTTVRDIGLLTRALIREFPEYGGYFHIGAIRFGKRVLKNYNPLLHYYRGADGMKTGYICDSGLNLVASATRGGRRIVAVLFGAQTGYERAAEARMLLDKGFTAGRSIFGHGTTLEGITARSRYGSAPTGYCRKPNPSVDDLLARYGHNPAAAEPVLGYANSKGVRQLPPGIRVQPVAAGTEKTATKRKGKKLSEVEILTRLVGRPQPYSTVTVRIGGADNVSPRDHLKPIDGIAMTNTGRDIPLPARHPVRMASTSNGPAGTSPGGSLYARAAGIRQDGRPARLLPDYPKVVGGIPVPQPNPGR